MNKKLINDVVGFGALVLLVILYIIFLRGTSPLAETVAATAKPVEVFDPTTLNQQTASVRAGQINGPLPINVPDQTPKDNPFHLD